MTRLIDEFPRPREYRVAFSGGLDSSVLLHLLAAARNRLPAPLSAVHVDHGLRRESASWARHCVASCERLGVALTVLAVDARPSRGESPEAAARDARYAAIAALMRADDMLLTAHHRDDQAETLLLQLLRGAGVDGLAGMPAWRAWQAGWLARPLLEEGRAAIRRWAEQAGLDWVDDPSNLDLAPDRNFVRHEVLPLLATRWPAASARIAHAAGLCDEAARLLRDVAADDYANAIDGDGCMPVAGLVGLDDARARQLLRCWLRQCGVAPLPAKRLREFLRQLRDADASTAVAVHWSGHALRRYRDRVWLGPSDMPPVPGVSLRWEGEGLSPGPGLGYVYRVAGAGGVAARHWRDGDVSVSFRHAGVECRPAGRGGTRSFKKIAQEYAVPPWLRDRLPILLIDGRVAAVANCCVCEPFAAPPGENGWLLRWEPRG